MLTAVSPVGLPTVLHGVAAGRVEGSGGPALSLVGWLAVFYAVVSVVMLVGLVALVVLWVRRAERP
jgi:hypothetical protein